MRSLKDIVAEQQAGRPSDDPVVETLMAELIRVAEELCVARDRLDTCLYLAGDAVSRAAVDAFEPSPEQTEQRLSRHTAFFEELFRRLASRSTSASQ